MRRPGAPATPGSRVARSIPSIASIGARPPPNCASRGLRLPTASEWELASRGADVGRYPWGDAAPTEQPCWSGPKRASRLGQVVRCCREKRSKRYNRRVPLKFFRERPYFSRWRFDASNDPATRPSNEGGHR
ncbi:MAG: SUMF1/EgtB/PvdO family nonheme iron enzyme [Deltaproteobacteria bacterium]|nr:SUMF1/EgtB/PvdO family nonheme iron enzyme [Deltaproteobacteria bacterium]